MTTPQTWAEHLHDVEQKIVNIAYGLATESTADGLAYQITRLKAAVREHHAMLENAPGQETRHKTATTT